MVVDRLVWPFLRHLYEDPWPPAWFHPRMHEQFIEEAPSNLIEWWN